MSGEIRFSIIIATKDRPEELRKCLRSVSKQSVPPYEVIIIDDGELDETYFDTIQSFLPKPTTLVVTDSNGEPGLSNARNTGMEVATGDVYVGLDDDSQIGPDYLKLLEESYQKANGNIAGIGGIDSHRKLSLPEYLFKRIFFIPVAWRINSVGIQGFKGGIDGTEQAEWLPGYNWSYRSAIADEVSFPQYNGGREEIEDVAFGWKLKRRGYTMLVDGNLPVKHHEEPDTEGAFVAGQKLGRNRVRYFRKFSNQFYWPVFIWSIFGEILKLLLTPLVGGPRSSAIKGIGVIFGFIKQSIKVNK